MGSDVLARAKALVAGKPNEELARYFQRAEQALNVHLPTLWKKTAEYLVEMDPLWIDDDSEPVEINRHTDRDGLVKNAFTGEVTTPEERWQSHVQLLQPHTAEPDSHAILVVVGYSGCGDMLCVEIGGAERMVFIDHETGQITMEWESVEAYLDVVLTFAESH